MIEYSHCNLPAFKLMSIHGIQTDFLGWMSDSAVDGELSFPGEYAFMGALIIQEVIKELVGKGLSNAKVLLLAGSRYVLVYATILQQTNKEQEQGQSTIVRGAHSAWLQASGGRSCCHKQCRSSHKHPLSISFSNKLHTRGWCRKPRGIYLRRKKLAQQEKRRKMSPDFKAFSVLSS